MIARSLYRRLLAVGLALTLAVLPGTAFAGPEEAKEYYEQAKQAYQEGELARAAELLERAYAEDPNLVYQYNRILALQGMGKHAEALRVLDIYENPMKEDGRFNDISQIRTELEKSLAEKKAEEKGDDGEDAKNGKNGKQSDETDDGPDGRDEMKADGPGDEKSDPKKKDSSSDILAWSLIGGGGATIVTGGLMSTGLFIPNVIDRAQCTQNYPLTECYDNAADEAEARELRDADRQTVKTHRTIAVVLMGVGAAAAAGGTYLLLRKSPSKSETSEAKTSGLRFRVAPYATSRGAGGVIHIEF